MKYILFAIILSASGEGSLEQIGTPHDTMADCFDARELYVEGKRPIINYQAICVIYNPK